jgi:hypothetical protein
MPAVARAAVSTATEGAPAVSEPSVVVTAPSDADEALLERPSVAADAETVLPPRVQVVPPPLPAHDGVLAVAEGGDTLDADDDLEDDDETPTGTDVALPEAAFSRRSYGPVVDLSRPTVQDLDQPPPLPMAIVPKQPVALARRAPFVLEADPNASILTRQLARRPVSTRMPLALMKPHVRIAKSLARDVRGSKREIVIGLSIGLTLAAPLFIAGHLYLQRSMRGIPVPLPSIAAAHVAPARPRPPVGERLHPPPAAAIVPERIQQAVAGLEPAPLELVQSPAGRPETSSAVSARPVAAAARPPKPPRKRPKPAPAVAPRPVPSTVSAQTVADTEEPELSPAERAGLTTTIPF